MRAQRRCGVTWRRQTDTSPIGNLDEILVRLGWARYPSRAMDLERESPLEAALTRSDEGAAVAIVGDAGQAGNRFRLARTVFLHHFSRNRTMPRRLVTEAHTWEQRASRAFAAEFLAPAAGTIQTARRESFARRDRRVGEPLRGKFSSSGPSDREPSPRLDQRLIGGRRLTPLSTGTSTRARQARRDIARPAPARNSASHDSASVCVTARPLCGKLLGSCCWTELRCACVGCCGWCCSAWPRTGSANDALTGCDTGLFQLRAGFEGAGLARLYGDRARRGPAGGVARRRRNASTLVRGMDFMCAP